MNTEVTYEDLLKIIGDLTIKNYIANSELAKAQERIVELENELHHRDSKA